MHPSRKFSRILLPAVLLALTANAATINGKWTGTLEIDQGGSGEKIETPVQLTLEQKDGVLSGRIGVSSDPQGVEIRNAKVEGDKVTFDASSSESSASMKFTLTIQGDRMLGEMKGVAHGNELVAKVALSRAPQ